MSVLPDVALHGPIAPPAPHRPAPVRRAPLFLVPPLVRSQARRAPFVLLVVGLLTAGLVGLLLLNTVLAQGSFQVHDLSTKQAALSDQEQSLARQADALADPGSLALRATKLGMVPSTAPSFLPKGQPLPAGSHVVGDLVIVPAPGAAKPTAPALTQAERLRIQARQRAEAAAAKAKAARAGTGSAAGGSR